MMFPSRLRLVAVPGVTLIASLFLVGGAATSSTPVMTMVASPQPGRKTDLLAIGAVSRREVWIVGDYLARTRNELYPMAERWDGDGWRLVRVPQVGGGAVLFGVSGRFNDVWAAGTYWQHGLLRTLAMHWDGRSWHVVPTPNAGSGTNGLFSIAWIAPDDVWAVGGYFDKPVTFMTLQFENADHALLEHWNGRQWSIVPVPRAAFVSRSTLNAVAGVSPSDVWAVGLQWVGGRERPLALHQNGRVWVSVPVPGPGSYLDGLLGVTVMRNHTAWAVGTASDAPGHSRGLAERWDGTSWRVVPTGQYPRSQLDSLFSVASSDRFVVAAGRYHDNQGGWPFNNGGGLVERWNGGRFLIVPAQKIGDARYANIFNSITIANRTVWTAGEVRSRATLRALIERSAAIR